MSDSPPNAPCRCAMSSLTVTASSGDAPEPEEPAVVVGRQALLGVVGDLLGPAAAPERVDARVLGDLIDPGLEGDRPLGLAHAPHRGDEDLLRDILGAPVILDHAEHVGGDPALVALVQRLESAVVAAPDPSHQLMIGGTRAGASRAGLEHGPTFHRGPAAVSLSSLEPPS